MSDTILSPSRKRATLRRVEVKVGSSTFGFCSINSSNSSSNWFTSKVSVERRIEESPFRTIVAICSKVLQIVSAPSHTGCSLYCKRWVNRDISSGERMIHSGHFHCWFGRLTSTFKINQYRYDAWIFGAPIQCFCHGRVAVKLHLRRLKSSWSVATGAGRISDK